MWLQLFWNYGPRTLSICKNKKKRKQIYDLISFHTLDNFVENQRLIKCIAISVNGLFK